MVHCQRRENGVVVLRLNRPDQRNALSRALLSALEAELERLQADLPRALILTGSGQAFCAGADLKERRAMTPEERSAHTDQIAALADGLESFPVPVLAAISGYCLAGGAELALACDMRLASLDAQFGFPEVHLGIFPGANGPVRLSRLLGAGAARSLLFTGRRLGAEEAYRLGMVEHLSADPLEQACQWANQIAAASNTAVRALKQALLESQDLPARQAMEVVRRHRRALDSSPDYEARLQDFGK